MSSIITIRLQKDVKDKANATLRELGITPSRAVQQLYDHIVKYGSLPFDNDEHPPGEEVKKRLAALSKLELKQPTLLDDTQIRSARIRERYDIDA